MTELTLLGFFLEVEADTEADLHDKLYGYDDIEAEAIARGYGPRELSFEEMQEMEPLPGPEWEKVQEEQETVNDLLRNAKIGGCPVLFKTDGTNLQGSDGPQEIPHFGHDHSCEIDCWQSEDAGGVWRLFPRADLIVEGDFDVSDVGRYWLRDDVQIHVSKAGKPGRGGEAATPVE